MAGFACTVRGEISPVTSLTRDGCPKWSPDTAVTLTWSVRQSAPKSKFVGVAHLALLLHWQSQCRHESCPSPGPLCVRRPANRRRAEGENCATPTELMPLAWLAPARLPFGIAPSLASESGVGTAGGDGWRRPWLKTLRAQPSPILLPTPLHSTPARHFPPFSARTF